MPSRPGAGQQCAVEYGSEPAPVLPAVGAFACPHKAQLLYAPYGDAEGDGGRGGVHFLEFSHHFAVAEDLQCGGLPVDIRFLSLGEGHCAREQLEAALQGKGKRPQISIYAMFILIEKRVLKDLIPGDGALRPGPGVGCFVQRNGQIAQKDGESGPDLGKQDLQTLRIHEPETFLQKEQASRDRPASRRETA